MDDFIIDSGNDMEIENDDSFDDSTGEEKDTTEELFPDDVAPIEPIPPEEVVEGDESVPETREFEYPYLDPGMVDPAIVGDPGAELENWHFQTYDDTCAIAVQEFILDGITGQDFKEDDLRQDAIKNGWYMPGGGTPLECTGNLLEANGVEVERKNGGTLDDITEKLEQGEKVIAGVDSDEIWTAGQNWIWDEFLSDLSSYPGWDANHVVQVIGINNTDPENPMVVLNDPGTPYGKGLIIPADEFLNAWEDSGHFMVSTTGRTIELAEQVAAGGSEIMFGALDSYGRPY